MRALLNRMGLLAVCLLAMSAPVDAAVIGTYAHDYGRRPGAVAPQTYGKLQGDRVIVENSAAGVTDFADSIDLSGIGVVGTDVTVDSIDLVLDYDRAGPNASLSEAWFVAISGAGSGFGLTTFAFLDDASAPQTVTLTAGSDAFDAALANLKLDFTFVEPGVGRSDTFRLYSATVRVNGSVIAAVPLPAPGLMLLAGLGGLIVMRRKSVGKDASQT